MSANPSAPINDLVGVATYLEFIYALHDDPAWAWSDPYWTWSSVMAEDLYGNKSPVGSYMANKQTDRHLSRLGCSGSHKGWQRRSGSSVKMPV